MTKTTCVHGLIAVAAMGALVSCYDYGDDYHGYNRRGRDCYVKGLVCGYYGCWYEWWCTRDNSCKDEYGSGRCYDDDHHDDGEPLADASPVGMVDGGSPDAGAPTVDGGATEDAGGGSGGAGSGCDGTGSCAAGFECLEGTCQACPDGICPCRSDQACGSSERCELETGRCVPIQCTDLRAESACLARGDCVAVYSGKNCRRADGKECEAGDSNCTCETFEFAVCSAS